MSNQKRFSSYNSLEPIAGQPARRLKYSLSLSRSVAQVHICIYISVSYDQMDRNLSWKMLNLLLQSVSKLWNILDVKVIYSLEIMRCTMYNKQVFILHANLLIWESSILLGGMIPEGRYIFYSSFGQWFFEQGLLTEFWCCPNELIRKSRGKR